MRKKKEKKKRNGVKEYNNILFLFTGLFVLLIGYLAVFQIRDSRSVINNSYNSRIALFEENVIRGSILASDGQILAYTEVQDDGTEKRVYPFGRTFAHVVGYSEYGKTGIENLGNFQLVTSNAYFIERFVNELREEKNIGDSLVTTLDVDLQTVAYNALGSYQGAVIVMEPETGNVLAMVSKPDYDPGTVAASWSELSDSEDGELLNRATQGLYPPGSIFKTVTLLEYLRENQFSDESFSYVCTGSIDVGNSSISCYHSTAHGTLDLETAFAKSCNSAFAQIGSELDLDKFNALADSLLFNSELPLDLPYNQSSFELDDTDSEAIRMMTAIGQGDTVVTPMHMAMLISAIANDGVLLEPRFLERTENYTGSLVESYGYTEYGSLMSENEAQILQKYLRAVVETGTASDLLSDNYTAYGKTGTAEYSSNKSESHAWFIGYVTGEKSDLAVCVLVESAGSGSDYAVPIAKKIFDAYYAD